MSEEQIAQGYEKEYSEKSFFEKLAEHAKAIGCECLRNALRLFYALGNPDMPLKIKAVIYGALGYLISPIDAIPDILPGLGFTDDAAVIAAAIAIASLYIDANAKAKADEKLKDWFGSGC